MAQAIRDLPGRLAQLNADGQLNVTIQKQGLFGDTLNLVASQLFVEYEDAPSGVPAPTTLILLGAGFVGAAARARRRN